MVKMNYMGRKGITLLTVIGMSTLLSGCLNCADCSGCTDPTKDVEMCYKDNKEYYSDRKEWRDDVRNYETLNDCECK